MMGRWERERECKSLLSYSENIKKGMAEHGGRVKRGICLEFLRSHKWTKLTPLLEFHELQPGGFSGA